VLWLHVNGICRVFVCPECGHVEKSPKKLGLHIERHRPDEEIYGKFLKCPKGCGRTFRIRHGACTPLALKEHFPLCNGKRPLPAVEAASLFGVQAALGAFEAGRKRGNGSHAGSNGKPSHKEMVLRFLRGHRGSYRTFLGSCLGLGPFDPRPGGGFLQGEGEVKDSVDDE
jgi:uncharacterized C2H2 Zn-finger protein